MTVILVIDDLGKIAEVLGDTMVSTLVQLSCFAQYDFILVCMNRL